MKPLKRLKEIHAPIALMILFIVMSNAHAANRENQLDFINNKIKSIHHTLTEETLALEKTHANLSENQNKLHHTEKQLHSLEQMMLQKKQRLLYLQSTLNTLRKKLQRHQRALSRHLTSRYTLHIRHDNMRQRMTTFYRHLLKKDSQLILENQQKTTKIQTEYATLERQFNQLSQLKTKTNTHLQRLSTLQKNNQQLITQLDTSIATAHHQLVKYQRNRRALQTLITSLSKAKSHSLIQQFKPFTGKFISPIDGTHLDTHPNGNHGFFITAPEGTPVRAVMAGKIVFSHWLNGYGQLLILDHGQGLMSLYAHNQSLLADKGSYVNQGEKIATVGHTGGFSKNGLYFELRRRGKVINPRQTLS